MNRYKFSYDLALICTKQCLNFVEPSSADDAVDLALKVFENCYNKILSSGSPVLEFVESAGID
ncbi:UNVERIFIED_CONTAM: hypothetical protein C7383_11559 [Murimonas intestini]|uniref:HEPN domain-containing protein n=1 Tax=Murimonas intestini TaxID=1337051 RepID=A0AB73SZC0_9FIRM